MMLAVFKRHERSRLLLALSAMSLACFGLWFFRMLVSGSPAFIFLNWNLFLAFLPWAFSTYLALKPDLHGNKLAIILLLFSWIIFFPNAPYILTDLFHLQKNLSMPVWYDLVLILSFAWTGLLFGLLSLMDIEKYLRGFMPSRQVMVTITVLLFLSAFGIYLGRYLRWNSWDIISEPAALLSDLTDRVIHPFEHPRTWGMTLFMGLLLNMIYWSFRLLRRQ